jgi:hypothetical protein
MFDHKLLDIYINDHRAASAAGLALARRSLRNNEPSAVASTLRDIVHEIEGEIGVLDEIARVLSVRPDPLKRVLGRVGEFVSRAKLNGQLTGYSPLSRLIEIETLMAGVATKRQLWLSLASSEAGKSLDAFEIEGLAHQAETQHARLTPHHHAAAAEALVLIRA